MNFSSIWCIKSVNQQCGYSEDLAESGKFFLWGMPMALFAFIFPSITIGTAGGNENFK